MVEVCQNTRANGTQAQKNQQEPTHFLPNQRKNTTFAMQNNEIKHTNNEIKIFPSIIATE